MRQETGDLRQESQTTEGATSLSFIVQSDVSSLMSRV